VLLAYNLMKLERIVSADAETAWMDAYERIAVHCRLGTRMQMD